MSESDNLSQEETLDILRRLSQAFKMVDEVLHSEVRGQIWVVHGQVGAAPTITTFDDVDALCSFITEMRMRQNATTDVQYYMHVFYGQRWKIQKGRVWQLWDGSKLTPIEGGTLAPAIDDSGSLFERVDMDSLLPERESPDSAPDAAPQVRIGPLNLTDDDDDDDDEVAPPGRDPEIG